MAYQTGTASSRPDLVQKICSFAVASGWTQDEYDVGNKRASLHKGNVYVHFWWDDVSTNDGGNHSIGMFQSLGYTGSTKPYLHPDDSGGYVAMTSYETWQDYQRMSVKYIGDGPFTGYTFFSHTDIDNIYCVLEVSAGIYRHFGFGNIDKFGTWTGGEWCGGHCFADTTKGSVIGATNSVLLDGLSAGTSYEYGYSGGRIHIEGFPGQAGSSKWGYVGDGLTTGFDRAGILRAGVKGGMRSSLWLNALNWLRVDALSGLTNLVPIVIFYRQTDLTPDALRLLGFMHNVYHIQMAAFGPGDEIVIGSDTYQIFPMVRKRRELDGNYESWNAGIAYKKVV